MYKHASRVVSTKLYTLSLVRCSVILKRLSWFFFKPCSIWRALLPLWWWFSFSWGRLPFRRWLALGRSFSFWRRLAFCWRCFVVSVTRIRIHLFGGRPSFVWRSSWFTRRPPWFVWWSSWFVLWPSWFIWWSSSCLTLLSLRTTWFVRWTPRSSRSSRLIRWPSSLALLSLHLRSIVVVLASLDLASLPPILHLPSPPLIVRVFVSVPTSSAAFGVTVGSLTTFATSSNRWQGQSSGDYIHGTHRDTTDNSHHSSRTLLTCSRSVPRSEVGKLPPRLPYAAPPAEISLSVCFFLVNLSILFSPLLLLFVNICHSTFFI